LKSAKIIPLLVSLATLIGSNNCTLALDSKPTVETLVKLFSQLKSTGPASASVLNQVAQYIDYKAMAEASLGQQWAKLSEAQREEFAKSFRSLVEKRYYPRWHKIFSKSQVSYGKESQENGVTRLKTQITLKDTVQEIDWDLKAEGAAAKVVNLTVEDKDLVVRAGKRFQPRLAKSGFPAFIAWINTQAAKSVSSED
jgi:phospholipid transport system substrate-binding protein